MVRRTSMFYFREEEMQEIRDFANTPSRKAMAVYGRRRTGKTELILHMIPELKNCLYFQVPGNDYALSLEDFKNELIALIGDRSIIEALSSFKSVFEYLSKTVKNDLIIVIDEFPFLAKKNDNVPYEFQWIIDHGLGAHMKLILLGSSLSFMKTQITDESSPLYGRFQTILKVRPFTFDEMRKLFEDFDECVNVYAMTGGVAQYVMFILEYGSYEEAVNRLFFNRNGRLFQEGQNLLRQELRDITVYTSVLRAIGRGEKDAQKIASAVNMDGRGIYTYLKKLAELEIVSEVVNPLPAKKEEKKYRIADYFMRFSYTFLEPHQSMISMLGKESKPYIMNEAYNEYLGFVYEDIIRDGIYKTAMTANIGFMPEKVGKWWGNVHGPEGWYETEADILAEAPAGVIVGECKYKNKAVGLNELELLKLKAQFIKSGKRKIVYLLASRKGFTDDLLKLRDDVILIEQDRIIQ